MKKLLLLAIALISVIDVTKSQQIEPNWESINARKYPQWFTDAKLGIFIHWGVYSVPAFSGKEGYAEWYYKGLLDEDSSRLAFQSRIYGKDWKYQDFDKLFKAELWDPDEWTDLFVKSGAKYVILVTKHHDGYCLWNSKYAPNWNSVSGGPKRNIVAELTKSVRKTDMKMGFYYSLPEWTNPLHIWSKSPNDSIGKYVNQHMIPQLKELISEYKPTILFADGEWFNSAEQWHSTELISWYYNLIGSEAIVNDRWGSGSNHGFRTPEYSAGITQTDRPWAECRGLGRSFALNRNEPLENYLSSNELIRHFVKLVAAGGGMTLNVGPAADGKIPLLQQERLLDLGKWLQTNGEAIYATRPYSKFYEVKDVVVKRQDSKIDFFWNRNSPDPKISYDNFTAEWNGFITSKKTEKYTFEIESQDAATVEIDGKQIINFNPEEEKPNNKGDFNLIAGNKHQIKVIYKENNMEAGISLSWKSISQPKEIIPESAYNELWATYYCQQPYICYTTKDNTIYAIAIEFPQNNLVLNLPKPKNKLNIKMLGCDKILPYKYKNGKLTINTTNLKYTDIKSSAAWVFKIENL